MDPQSVAPEEGGGTLNDGTIVDDHQRLALLQVEEEFLQSHGWDAVQGHSPAAVHRGV